MSFYALDTGLLIQVVETRESKEQVLARLHPIWLAQTQGEETAIKLASNRFDTFYKNALTTSLQNLLTPSKDPKEQS